MRSFSTSRTVSKALRFIKKGITQDVQWVENQVESSIDQVPALAAQAVHASIEGNPHPTPKADGTVDPWHASGTITSASGTRLTSYHAYPSGLTVFSKGKYGQVMVPPAEGPASQTAMNMQPTQPQTTQAASTSLTWQLNAEGFPEWWNGERWVQGQYFPEHQKWMAWYCDQWHVYHS